jgi:hypothetical protein
MSTKAKPQQPVDIAKMFANLRARTCAFLKAPPYDQLAPYEQVRIDVIGALMLEIDDLRQAQLSGRTDVDIARLVQAGEAIQRLLLPLPGVIGNSAIAEEDARNRMREVLTRIAPDIVEQSDRDAERERLEAQAADQLDEPEEPEQVDEPQPSSDPPPAPALPSNVVRYHSVKRGPNGEHPPHYVKRELSDALAVPHFPLPPPRSAKCSPRTVLRA